MASTSSNVAVVNPQSSSETAELTREAGEVRIDPDPIEVGDIGVMDVHNRDPNRHYVWVSNAKDLIHGQSFYRRLGYRIEVFSSEPDAIRVDANSADLRVGSPITQHDCTLMSISKQQYAFNQLHGRDASRGLKFSNEQLAKVFKKGRIQIEPANSRYLLLNQLSEMERR